MGVQIHQPWETDAAPSSSACDAQSCCKCNKWVHRDQNPAPTPAGNPRFILFLGSVILCGCLLLTHGRTIPELATAQGLFQIGLALVAGLITGTHCSTMCGGFALACSSRQIVKKNIAATLSLYALGKTLSYGMIGALLGALGRFLLITTHMRIEAALIGGFFMLWTAAGLNAQTGASLKHLSMLIPQDMRSFAIGIGNGAMIACGPLQAMYIVCAASGSALQGLLVMTAFALGTLPMLLGLSVVIGSLKPLFNHSASLLIRICIAFFGLNMISQAMALSGNGSLAFAMEQLWSQPPIADKPLSSRQIIYMKVLSNEWVPNRFNLSVGTPVVWVIDADDLSLCTQQILVPSLNLSVKLHRGRNIVLFTPAHSGTIHWSCWMGMVNGAFDVEDEDIHQSAPGIPKSPNGV